MHILPPYGYSQFQGRLVGKGVFTTKAGFCPKIRFNGLQCAVAARSVQLSLVRPHLLEHRKAYIHAQTLAHFPVVGEVKACFVGGFTIGIYDKRLAARKRLGAVGGKGVVGIICSKFELVARSGIKIKADFAAVIANARAKRKRKFLLPTANRKIIVVVYKNKIHKQLVVKNMIPAQRSRRIAIGHVDVKTAVGVGQLQNVAPKIATQKQAVAVVQFVARFDIEVIKIVVGAFERGFS